MLYINAVLCNHKAYKEKHEFPPAKVNTLNFPDSNIHGVKVGPIWGRQGPGGSHVGPTNLGIWVAVYLNDVKYYSKTLSSKFTVCRKWPTLPVFLLLVAGISAYRMDCPNASEVTLKRISKCESYLNTTKHKKHELCEYIMRCAVYCEGWVYSIVVLLLYFKWAFMKEFVGIAVRVV